MNDGTTGHRPSIAAFDPRAQRPSIPVGREPAADGSEALVGVELDALYRGAPMGLAVLDRELRFVRANERLAEITGAPAPAHPGRPLRDVAPDLHGCVEAALRRVLASGDPVHDVEYACETPATPGVRRTWSLRCLPLRDARGAVTGVSIVADERTAQRAIEGALVDSLGRLSAAQVASGLGVHDWDVAADRIFWDARVRAIWGLGADDPVTYATFAAGVDPTDLPGVEVAVARASDPAGDGAYRCTFGVRNRGDGRLQVALSNPAVIVAQCDARARYLWIHNAPPEFHGLGLIGRTDTEVVDNPGTRALEALKREVLATGQDGRATITVPMVAGERSWDVLANAVRDARGAIEGVATTAVEVTERVVAQRALDAERARLQALGDNLPDSMLYRFVVEPDGSPRYEYVSAGVERMLGVSVAQVLADARSLHDRIPAPDRARLRALKEHSARTLADIDCELPFQRADGELRTMRLRSRPRREPGGRVAWDGVLVDVTGTRRIEQQLRDSEARFRAMAEGLPLLVWVHDASGAQEFVNQAFCRFFGVTREQMRGGAWQVLIHPDDQAGYTAEFERCVTVRVPFNARCRARDGAGRWRWVESWGQPRFGDDGTFLGFVGGSADITEHELATRALQQQHRHLDLMARTSQRLVFATAPDEALFGSVFTELAMLLAMDLFYHYRPGPEPQTLRLHLSGGLTDADRERFATLRFGERLCGRVAESRRPLVIEDLPTRGEPGSEALAAAGVLCYAGFPLLVDDDLLGTVAFASRTRARIDDDEIRLIRTLCDQIAATHARVRLVHALREADRRKDEFLAVLSHELRNPLAPLVNTLRMLERFEPLGERGSAALAVAQRQVGQLRTLVDDLLEVSRISQGKIELRRERTLLAALAQQAGEMVAADCAARRHRLTFVPPPAPVWVDADPVRVVQMLTNLLNNACKYTPDGGRIEVTTTADDRMAEIRVADTGIGIERDKMARVFELFGQIDATSARSQGGLGIGLSLTRRLAQLHGGSVHAVSDGLGCGATFVLRLPLSVEAAAGDGRPRGRPAEGGTFA